MGPHLIPAYFFAIGLDISPPYPSGEGQSLSLKGDAENAKHFDNMEQLLKWWERELMHAATCELMFQKIAALWHERPDLHEGIRRFAAPKANERMIDEITDIAIEAPTLGRQAAVERGREFAPLVWSRPNSDIRDVLQEFIIEEDRKALAQAVGGSAEAQASLPAERKPSSI